jgi:hypothetical protein
MFKYWKVLQWMMLESFVAILFILRPNGIFYGHLVHFVVIWYIFPHFGIFTEKNLASLLKRIISNEPEQNVSRFLGFEKSI